MLRFRAPNLGRYGKRHIPGEMNQTEAAYAECLEGRRLAGEVVKWWFESMTLKIARDCRFTADFTVFLADGSIEVVDVKGAPTADDALVKIKAAAQEFFPFKFVQEKKLPKRLGGGWERREF